MARTEIDVAAPPQRIFEVLLDPRHFGHWVPGAREVRGWDDDWPRIGSRFHHTLGAGPLGLKDHSVIVELDPPHRFVLLAKARPGGTFRMTLEVSPNATGSHVVMTEEPGDRGTRLMFNPLTEMLLRGRNRTSLARLRDVAEGRGPAAADSHRPG